ncbi:hypothetical protein FRB90_002797 [Tulasnella sp. 427]|nr:hypothetical protein FRB90_002797 [Tulasnella sp. 427]
MDTNVDWKVVQAPSKGGKRRVEFERDPPPSSARFPTSDHKPGDIIYAFVCLPKLIQDTITDRQRLAEQKPPLRQGSDPDPSTGGLAGLSSRPYLVLFVVKTADPEPEVRYIVAPLSTFSRQDIRRKQWRSQQNSFAKLPDFYRLVHPIGSTRTFAIRSYSGHDRNQKYCPIPAWGQDPKIPSYAVLGPLRYFAR